MGWLNAKIIINKQTTKYIYKNFYIWSSQVMKSSNWLKIFLSNSRILRLIPSLKKCNLDITQFESSTWEDLKQLNGGYKWDGGRKRVACGINVSEWNRKKQIKSKEWGMDPPPISKGWQKGSYSLTPSECPSPLYMFSISSIVFSASLFFFNLLHDSPSQPYSFLIFRLCFSSGISNSGTWFWKIMCMCSIYA